MLLINKSSCNRVLASFSGRVFLPLCPVFLKNVSGMWDFLSSRLWLGEAGSIKKIFCFHVETFLVIDKSFRVLSFEKCFGILTCDFCSRVDLKTSQIVSI